MSTTDRYTFSYPQLVKKITIEISYQLTVNRQPTINYQPPITTKQSERL
ncbi:hypothetical protein [Chroococcidiopsis sp [FACHB-1243]]|nr:hypothetical protein [Chroococcidiopsis sp. [FACHB-1243]]